MVRGVDHVISMVPRKTLPAYVLEANIRTWNVPDPGGMSYEVLEKTKDHTHVLTRTFAEELTSSFAIAAFCILTTPSNKILLQHRTPDAPTNPSRWQLFGGAREDNESSRETLNRELREELAITVEPETFEYLISIKVSPSQSFSSSLGVQPTTLLLAGGLLALALILL